MNYDLLIFLIIGYALGLGTALLLRRVFLNNEQKLAENILKEGHAAYQEWAQGLSQNMRDSFGNLSLTALARSSEELIKLARSQLGEERSVAQQNMDKQRLLMEGQITHMSRELEAMRSMVREFENDRAKKYGEIASSLQTTHEKTSALSLTTEKLQRVLSNSQARGQWGERMADDILQKAGFIENINYLKQETSLNAGTRPDFTFLLPKNLTLNMDVKFPLANYLKYHEEAREDAKNQHKNAFLKDVKQKIKEVQTREYINPEANTIELVILLIPSEQVFAFISQYASDLIDEALRHKVLCCSPLTLFPVLAIIRQSIDNFALEQKSTHIIEHLGRFKLEWQKYTDTIEKLRKKFGDVAKEFEQIAGPRRRKLEKPLEDITAALQKELPAENGLTNGENTTEDLITPAEAQINNPGDTP